MPQHPYERPEFYELAFSWRDYSLAVDFLSDAVRLAGVSSLSSMVELGCGPAQYAREFALRGVSAVGLDLSAEMTRYAQNIFDQEKLPGYALEADMRDFELNEPVDLALCMMATFCLLTTNHDVVGHFGAVARNLNPGGLYIIELPHPRDVFNAGQSTNNTWEMKKDGGRLAIDWASDAKFDPITETSVGQVRMTWEKDGPPDELIAPETSRNYSLGLLKALVDLQGSFEITKIYGDINVDVPFDNDKKAWRMVPVLRKK